MLCTQCGSSIIAGLRDPAGRLCDSCFSLRMPLLQSPSAAGAEMQLEGGPIRKDSELKCVICMGELKEEPAYALSCAHVFHASCLNRWLPQNNTCPICKRRNSHPLPPPVQVMQAPHLNPGPRRNSQQLQAPPPVRAEGGDLPVNHSCTRHLLCCSISGVIGCVAGAPFGLAIVPVPPVIGVSGYVGGSLILGGAVSCFSASASCLAASWKHHRQYRQCCPTRPYTCSCRDYCNGCDNVCYSCLNWCNS
jgi:hypothetical protein